MFFSDPYFLSQANSVTENSMILKWTNPKTDIDGLKIKYKSQNLFAKYDEISIKSESNRNQIELSGLSPGESYSISINCFKSDLEGPSHSIVVKTTGSRLPIPIITHYDLVPQEGTSVKLSWEFHPKSKSDTKWDFGIFYGASYYEMVRKANPIKTDKTSYTVSNLNACQSYNFVVLVVGPKGIGNPSEHVTISTKYSPRSSPKNVTVSKDQDQMVVRWESSCPKMAVDDNIKYIVKVEDLVKNSSREINVDSEGKAKYFY